MRPEFADNRNGNTLAQALVGHLSWLRQTYTEPVDLAIATGYFNPEGFACLAEELQHVRHLRLLLGAEPQAPPVKVLRRPGDPRGERYEARQVDRALEAVAEGLENDRNLLGFTRETDAALQRLLDFLRSEQVEVRRYERQFLHGKAFIFAGDEGVLCGSSNFTAAGLLSNLELNLGRYDPTPVQQVQAWFDDLWEQSAPYDLAAVYEARFEEYPPYLIFLRILWELYGEELTEEAQERGEGQLPLTTFQNDGLFRARRILQRYNGVLIADGVGLGKTFLGGELLREAIHERRQRALLISPAALRDGTWRTFANRFQLYFENISYEQLVARDLAHDPREYALIVIDEAQGFRKPDTRRAEALRWLLQGDPPKQLVLLSATPVNNSLWDLYYLLTYFIGHDAAFADRGIISLQKRFQEAMKEDPYELRPEVLFDVLDTTTVRRTRHFVRRYYPNDRVMGPGGQLIPVRFPTPHVRRVEYDFDGALPGFFDQLEAALAPKEGPPQLKMARYSPSQYLEGDEKVYEVMLVGLLRSALLKRFESSVHAFARTCRTMVEAHGRFLQALDHGYIASGETLAEIADTDNDEALEELLQEGEALPATNYRTADLGLDVTADRDLLLEFAETADAVTAAHDPKLAALVEQLAEIAAQAEREGLDEEDSRNRRKVLIFSYYADTVSWIEGGLRQVFASDPRLACYADRLASVSSDDSRGGVSRADAIFGFAPVSTEAPANKREDRFDILVATDVLAEGMNLQQCCQIINYDLPWNPMRLVQRNGRIDRIGSHYDDVYVRCFFPDQRLEDLLELEERLRRKLAQAAASVGLEHEVIPGAPAADIVFSETREEIERLRREEADLLISAGEDPSAHSGEEYRQELRRGLQRGEREIKGLPWAAGSGLARGERRGHVFCARVGEQVFLRFVPAEEEAVVRDRLTCLSLVTCAEDTPRQLSGDLQERAYAAWEQARNDIFEEWMIATDPLNLQPRLRRLFRVAAEHLRDHPPVEMAQDELDFIVDALQAPWGNRVAKLLREVFSPDETYATEAAAREASSAIIAKVRELGLRPYKVPEPLPVISEDEIMLVCWMAVEAGQPRG